MKTILLFFFLTGFCSLVKSQDYDLIVNTKADSIACHIDSITDTHIYFQMKVNSKWISTYLLKEDVKTYSKDAIAKKNVNFIPRSSLIDNSSSLAYAKNTIHTDIGTAIFWGFYSINYEISIKENPGRNIIRFRTGFLYRFDDKFYGIPLGVTALYGKSNKFFELSAAIVPGIEEEWEESSSSEEGRDYYRASFYPQIDIGYRKEPGKNKIFYRFKIGSTGLGLGIGYTF